MDPNEEFHMFHQAALERMRYIHALMGYIAEEWDVPNMITPAHVMFFNRCCEKNMLIPNAAGLFAEKFLKGAEQL